MSFAVLIYAVFSDDFGKAWFTIAMCTCLLFTVQVAVVTLSIFCE